jgi:hypothetical protein
MIFIADAPAHGRQFCGHQNHENEAPKLVPLIVRVAKAQIFVQGLDLDAGAALSFQEFKRIYEEAGGPSFTHEQFSVGYRQAYSPAPRRLDVLGRDVDAADYPKDFASDEDYDEDEDTRGLPRRRNRAPVIDDTAVVISSAPREAGHPEGMEERLSRAVADIISRARGMGTP